MHGCTDFILLKKGILLDSIRNIGRKDINMAEYNGSEDQRATSSIGKVINANIGEFTSRFEGIPEAIDLADGITRNEPTPMQQRKKVQRTALRNLAVHDIFKRPNYITPQTLQRLSYIDKEVIEALSLAAVQFQENGVANLNNASITDPGQLYKAQLMILNDCMMRAGYPWSERPHFTFMSRVLSSIIRAVRRLVNQQYKASRNALLEQLRHPVYVDKLQYDRDFTEQKETKSQPEKGQNKSEEKETELSLTGPGMPPLPGMDTTQVYEAGPPLPALSGEAPKLIDGKVNDKGMSEESDVVVLQTSAEDGLSDLNESLETSSSVSAPDIAASEAEKMKRSQDRAAQRDKTYGFLVKNVQNLYNEQKQALGDRSFEEVQDMLYVEALKKNEKFLIKNIESIPPAVFFANKNLAQFAISAEIEHIKNTEVFKKYHPMEKYNIPMIDGAPDTNSKGFKQYEKDLFKAAIKKIPAVSIHYVDPERMNTAVEMVLNTKETLPYIMPAIAEMNGDMPVITPNGRIKYKEEFIKGMAEAFGSNIVDPKNAEKQLKYAKARLDKIHLNNYNTFGYRQDEIENINRAEQMTMSLVHELIDDTAAGVVNRAFERTSSLLLQMPAVKTCFSREENYQSLAHAVQELNSAYMEEEYKDTYGWLDKRAYVNELYNDITHDREVQQSDIDSNVTVQPQQTLAGTPPLPPQPTIKENIQAAPLMPPLPGDHNIRAHQLIDAASTARCNLDINAEDYMNRETEIIKGLANDLYGRVDKETFQMAKDAIYNEDARDIGVTITDSNQDIGGSETGIENQKDMTPSLVAKLQKTSSEERGKSGKGLEKEYDQSL